MTTDLETRLARDLSIYAERGSRLDLDLDVVVGRADRRRRRRGTARGLGALGALFGAGSVGLLTTGAFDDDVADGPTRAEAPLTVVPAATALYEVVRGDAVGFRLADGQTLSFGVAANAYFDTYTAHACMTLDRGGWCNTGTPADDRPVSAEPELGGTDTVVYWTGVPAGAELVEFHSAEGVLWQHPVGGIAAFPSATHAPTDELIAYGEAGAELARVSWASTRMTGNSEATDEFGQFWTRTYFTALPDPVPPVVDVARFEELDDEEELVVYDFANNSMRSCLTNEGPEAWSSCVASTDAALKAHLTG